MPSRMLQRVFDLVRSTIGGDSTATASLAQPREGFPRILCVDDDEAVLKTVQRQLADSFDTVGVMSAAEATVALRTRGPFDVIICDLRMPGTNGLTFLHQAFEIAPATERIILTGHVDPTTMAVARGAGHAVVLLTKPCPARVLRDAVSAAVTRGRAAQALLS